MKTRLKKQGFTRLLKDGAAPRELFSLTLEKKIDRGILNHQPGLNRRQLTTPSYSAGFTMLEMMVVMAIVLALTAIVIMYIPQFRDRSGLDLIAQEIAITVRQAQVYASGGKVQTAGTTIKPSYGVYFEQGADEFFLFTNSDSNEGYQPDTEEEQKFELHGIVISQICVWDGTLDCTKNDLTVTYTRPQLSARICSDGDCGYSLAKIIIRTERSAKEKSITVHKNGQISVENI